MRGNLPKTVTPFIGRRGEMGEVRDRLVKTPVLTLTGPGGVGKTRLALAVAADRQRAFPDGVWYVALDGVDNERLLVAHVANVLGHRYDAQGGDLTASLTHALRTQHLLLILDNCEHLLEGVARLVDSLGRACPDIRILATSRTPLPVIGNVAYLVSPLGMPSSSAAASARILDASDAVRFFLDRARTVLPDFRLTDENRATVYELLDGLDRLPLAIELATAQLRARTLPDLARSVANHQAVLDWGTRRAPLRQHTMRSSLQWSASLCTPGERQLWAGLSVFRGSFDLDAVEAVCSDGSTSEDVIDLLQGLVEHSLVTREDHGAVVRYSMLEVVRQFGQDLLTEQAADALRTRHMAWFLGLIARADADWNTERQKHWLHNLPLDHHNIARALATATDEKGTADAAAVAVCQLWRYYWWACGWLAEGLYWVERCSKLLTTPVLRARLLLLGSLLAFTVGDDTSGTALLDAGTSLADESGDHLARALAEHVLGDAAMYTGRLSDAVDHFRRALALYDADSPSHRVDTLLMLTLACAARGDLSGAEAAHLETLLTLDPAEQFQRSYSMLYVGEALRCQGSTDRALETVREALRLKSQFDDPFGMAWTLAILAEIACDAEKHERAAILLGAAHRMWNSMAIDAPLLERLQIHDRSTRERLRSATGSKAFADHCRRGETLDAATAVAIAFSKGALPRAPQTGPGVLTPREWEIAGLIADGLTNKQIASKLLIAQRTADAYVQNILTKLGFNSRAQIAAWISVRSQPTQLRVPGTGAGQPKAI
jgi:predicted ATPase/DNA-binding CsgD family transcriptional regulator